MSKKSPKEHYLSEVNLKETNPVLVSLSHLAEKRHIPIIQPEGLAFLKQVIQLRDIKKILEIGTAIGYSTIGMASVNDTIQINTIERNQTLFNEAREIIKNTSYNPQITMHLGDAVEEEFAFNTTFDLIFIDAAKAQNRKLFEKYERFLNPKGIIIVDNLLFHDMVSTQHTTSRNLRALTRKIDEFNRYIINREDYDTTIYPIGDGMSLSIKR